MIGELYAESWLEMCMKDTPWKTWHQWKDNIEINLIKIGFGGCEWGRWNCSMELFYIILVRN